jgi:putative ABC transport system ATP-binding protein
VTHPIISVRDLAKVYDSGEIAVHALRGVSISIAPGESVAIMGSSGSGKSTLMNILGCLDRPTSGEYLLAGQAVAGLDRNRLAEVRNRTIGFVFQSFNLLPRTTAVENVELPLVYAGVGSRERKARARRALERVGLGERLHHHPNQLSGGQQQRVAIARALVSEPGVILADEPTGNLDSRTSADVMAVFQELAAAGMTVVLVTHEPDIAKCASRVIEMADGLVVLDRRQPPTPAHDAILGVAS